MTVVPVASWSNVRATTTRLTSIDHESTPIATSRTRFIARGAGRSFGDAAFLTGGLTIASAPLTRVGEVDVGTRRIDVDAGVSMVDLHAALERTPFYVPVYGGTPWATVGGALASDIHGKSDPASGSFGNHVESITVTLASGETVTCSHDNEPGLFAATIGGMGLTGFVRGARLALAPRPTQTVRVRARTFRSLGALMHAFDEDASPYQVADCTDLDGARPGGIFWSAEHVAGPRRRPSGSSDVWLPRVRAFHPWTVRAMEHVLSRAACGLDVIRHVRDFNYGGGHTVLRRWNRLFGRRGFIEYHFVLPEDRFLSGLELLRAHARRADVPLFFGVVKRLGHAPRAGMLSFPAPGFGMNFQTPDAEASRRMLVRFTDTLLELGGRVYLAKDAVITPRQLDAMYPRLDELRAVAARFDPSGRVQSDLSLRLRIKA